jgi:thymidylate synthase ThyX
MTTDHKPATQPSQTQMRVYPLDPRALSQEQIAVTFAMTSRSPEPFDVIKDVVSEAKAADFNEKWVLNYGHASVAEHAVIHMACEDISRIAADDLEDARLASYTERSSRYQVIDRGSFHIPAELRGHRLEQTYIQANQRLFDIYHALLEKTMAYLKGQHPQKEGEKPGAYTMRLRRIATDHCRFVLPAATLTKVGVTVNARILEHSITKLLSSDLAETKELGERLKVQGKAIAPTLVKYADYNAYIAETRRGLQKLIGERGKEPAIQEGRISAKLKHYDDQAGQKIIAAILFHWSGESYDDAWGKANELGHGRVPYVEAALGKLGAHDAPLRELEMIDYTFEMEMDYGAYREYKRHRIQTYIEQPFTPYRGYIVPTLVREAKVQPLFDEAMELSAMAFRAIAGATPAVAAYVLTHAHQRRLIAKFNLREAYHLLKLRGSPQAHYTIREVALQALAEIERVHPTLIKFIRMRG